MNEPSSSFLLCVWVPAYDNPWTKKPQDSALISNNMGGRFVIGTFGVAATHEHNYTTIDYYRIDEVILSPSDRYMQTT